MTTTNITTNKIGTIEYSLDFSTATDSEKWAFDQVDNFYYQWLRHNDALAIKAKHNRVTMAQLHELLYGEYYKPTYGFLYHSLKNSESPVHRFLVSKGYKVVRTDWKGKTYYNLELDKQAAPKVVREETDESVELFGLLKDAIDKRPEWSSEALGTIKRYMPSKQWRDLLDDELRADESFTITSLKEIGFRVVKRASKSGAVTIWVTKSGCATGTRWGQEYGQRQREKDFISYLRNSDYNTACIKFKKKYGVLEIPMNAEESNRYTQNSKSN